LKSLCGSSHPQEMAATVTFDPTKGMCIE